MQNLDLLVFALLGLNAFIEAAPVPVPVSEVSYGPAMVQRDVLAPQPRNWLSTAVDDTKDVAKSAVHDAGDVAKTAVHGAEKVDSWAHSSAGKEVISDGEKVGKAAYQAYKSPLGQKVVSAGKQVLKGAEKAAPEVAETAAEDAPEIAAAAL
jgi:hypothetical protein